MIDLDLAGKIVTITGGASNIGRGIVHAFAAQGAFIVLVDIDREKADQTEHEAIEKGAAGCAVVLADLSTTEECVDTVGRILREHGHIDVLVNNFGWGDPGLLLKTTPDQWDRLWRMNLGATIGCSQAALDDMKKRQAGAIINLASDAAQGIGNQSVYGAMKGGIITFTRAVAREFGRYGIRANVISPGIVYPEPGAAGQNSVWNRGAPVLTEEQIEGAIEAAALRRPTAPADIAQAALFLASEVTARQVTGQHISVSGGWWMP